MSSQERIVTVDTDPKNWDVALLGAIEKEAFGGIDAAELNAIGCSFFRKGMGDVASRLFLEAARLGDAFALVNLADAVCDEDAAASRALLVRALAESDAAPYAARRLADELLPFCLEEAKGLLQASLAAMNTEGETKAAAELLDEVNGILASGRRRIADKCRWIGPCSMGENRPGESVDLIEWRARRGLFVYDYAVFCDPQLDGNGHLKLKFRRSRLGARFWEGVDAGEALWMKMILGTLPDAYVARMDEVREWISEDDPWKPCEIDLGSLGVSAVYFLETAARVREYLGSEAGR